jgi:hypothetical protein
MAARLSFKTLTNPLRLSCPAPPLWQIIPTIGCRPPKSGSMCANSVPMPNTASATWSGGVIDILPDREAVNATKRLAEHPSITVGLVQDHAAVKGP